MRKVYLTVATVVTLFVFGSASAATWYVDGSVVASGGGTSWATALTTIQEGIDAASEGDIVIVAPGTYVENIVFGLDNLVLRSTNPWDPLVVAETAIDGGHVGSCISMTELQGPETVISGFTITNGSAEDGGGIWGGPYYPRARIEWNVIVNNSASSTGGGLYRCNGVIQYNVIGENEAGYGAGLAYCGGTIRYNHIVANTASTSGGGFGLCSGTIAKNTIERNIAAELSGGGLRDCSGLIIGNVICENEAGHQGGGLSGCEGTIMGNVICSNSASSAGGGLANCVEAVIQSNVICGNSCETNGGGIFVNDGVVLNNTIVGNSAGMRGGGLHSCRGTIANCILWENSATDDPQITSSSSPSYCCIQDWTGGGENNVTANPLFVDADGPDDDPGTCDDNNYRLLSGVILVSPCIDSGNTSVLYQPGLDADGNLRIARGKEGSKYPVVDMGAYELASVPFSIIEITDDSSGNVTLTWNSQVNEIYRVWSRSDLLSDSWVEEATVSTEGGQTTWTDSAPTTSKKYYRVKM